MESGVPVCNLIYPELLAPKAYCRDSAAAITGINVSVHKSSPPNGVEKAGRREILGISEMKTAPPQPFSALLLAAFIFVCEPARDVQLLPRAFVPTSATSTVLSRPQSMR